MGGGAGAGRCRVAAVALHARLHAELQRLPAYPARPLPLRSAALPRPAASFGKQYDKNGDYIRHFMPVLKVGWGGCGAPAWLRGRVRNHVRNPRPVAAPHRAEPAVARLPPLLLSLPLQDIPAKYIYGERRL